MVVDGEAADFIPLALEFSDRRPAFPYHCLRGKRRVPRFWPASELTFKAME